MPAIDTFKSFITTVSDPVAHAAQIVPNNGTDLPHVTRVLYVGGAGNIRVTMADGSVVTFMGMTTGWHPVRVSRVHATATTATNIIAAW